MTFVKDLLRLNTDLFMAGSEMVLSRLARKRLCSRARRGDGQRVLLLPGFLAGDRSLGYLSRFLDDCGFEAETWGLGRVRGFRPDETGEAHMDRMSARIIERVRELSGGEGKVALVGQSLGGLYARETAARYPGEIDRIVTLGSPTVHPYIADDQNALAVRASGGKESGSRYAIAGREGFLHWGADDPALPCVAIWSPIDAIVFTRSARIPDYIVALSRPPAIRENVRIVCSHTGMGFNEAVLLALADRLAEPIDGWQPFDPEDYYSPWAISLVERTLGSRFFHEFAAADWRASIGAEEVAVPGLASAGVTDDGDPGLIVRLRQDHRDFLRLYRLLADTIEAEGFGADTDYLLLADVVRFMTDYLDRRHHALEEFIVGQLAEGDPQLALVLGHLAEEHERIEADGRALLKVVEDAGDPARPRSPEALLERWQGFCEDLRRHVEAEEVTLFPHLVEQLPAGAWPAIEEAWYALGGGDEDPLGGVAYTDEFRQLFEYLSYVASRDSPDGRPEGQSLFARCLDGMMVAGDAVDRFVARRKRSEPV